MSRHRQTLGIRDPGVLSATVWSETLYFGGPQPPRFPVCSHALPHLAMSSSNKAELLTRQNVCRNCVCCNCVCWLVSFILNLGRVEQVLEYYAVSR
jgi:hypothetical protein